MLDRMRFSLPPRTPAFAYKKKSRRRFGAEIHAASRKGLSFSPALKSGDRRKKLRSESPSSYRRGREGRTQEGEGLVGGNGTCHERWTDPPGPRAKLSRLMGGEGRAWSVGKRKVLGRRKKSGEMVGKPRWYLLTRSSPERNFRSLSQ